MAISESRIFRIMAKLGRGIWGLFAAIGFCFCPIIPMTIYYWITSPSANPSGPIDFHNGAVMIYAYMFMPFWGPVIFFAVPFTIAEFLEKEELSLTNHAFAFTGVILFTPIIVTTFL
jgi:hypothetical protein